MNFWLRYWALPMRADTGPALLSGTGFSLCGFGLRWNQRKPHRPARPAGGLKSVLLKSRQHFRELVVALGCAVLHAGLNHRVADLLRGVPHRDCERRLAILLG